MKKILFNSAGLLCLLFGFNSHAQTIPNPNFENWTSTNYNEPSTWTSSNGGSLEKNNTITTSSVTGFSGKAVRLQTSIIGPDTSFAYIVYGPGGDPINGQGGLPYSQKPANLTGYYRYNLPGNDTAVGLVSFKRNGSVICSNTFKIRGTGSQTVFTSFTYSLAAQSLTVNPDTVIIAFASSNALGNVGMQNNSYLELDQLNFTGAGITQTITNGDFETWTPQTYDKVNGWAVAGGNVTKITPGQTGPFAVEMQTALYPGNFVGQSGITNGYYPPQGGPPKGGLPYTMTQDTLYGYYKFSGSNDSGIVYVTLKKNGVNIGGSLKYLKSQANWAPFKVSISSGTTPDTMRVEIYSSAPGPAGPGAIGSKLSIDNLSLSTQQPLGLFQLSKQNNFVVYPNPAADNLVIRSANPIIGYKVYDLKGMNLNIKGDVSRDGNTHLDISSLPPGLYFLSVTDRLSRYNCKFIKE